LKNPELSELSLIFSMFSQGFLGVDHIFWRTNGGSSTASPVELTSTCGQVSELSGRQDLDDIPVGRVDCGGFAGQWDGTTPVTRWLEMS
jgi:hypothetical protein